MGGVLAGIALRVGDCVAALTEAGVRTRTLRVSGKLTRLRGFVDLLADSTQVPVEVSEEEETGLSGIARLAATGLTGETSGLMISPRARRRAEPRWSPRRAKKVRERWTGFVASHLAAGDSGPVV